MDQRTAYHLGRAVAILNRCELRPRVVQCVAGAIWRRTVGDHEDAKVVVADELGKVGLTQ